MHKFSAFGFLVILVLLVAVLLSGLFIDNRIFTWQQPHVPMQADAENVNFLVARNYKQLLDRAQAVLLAGETEANIRFYGAAENLSAELARACAELKDNTPIGAFAVTSIQMTPTQMLSYQNIRLTVSYHRTEAELAALQPLNASSDLPGILQTALLSGAPSVVLTMDYYSPELLNFSENLTTACQNMPEICYGLSGYEIFTYPNQGLSRIVEICFSYDTSFEESTQRKKAAEAQLSAISSQAPTENTIETLRYFRDQIISVAQPVSRTTSMDDTPYGVLLQNRGSAFGMASTFYQLCSKVGIPCYLISGTHNGTPHTWNMVYLEHTSYHIDLSRECLSPTNGNEFLISSEDMHAYTWKNPVFRY